MRTPRPQPANDRLRRSADKWFGPERLGRVHDVLKQAGSEKKQVKVAILDTGVDGTHNQIRTSIQSGAIFAGKGFPSSLEPFQDVHGHGTHAASVFLQTAPNALLCVARICAQEEDLESDYQRIADVSAALKKLC
jgi:subtilisin family serine protease